MNYATILFGGLFGVATIIAFYDRIRQEEKLKIGSIKPGRKTALIEPLMLPLMLVIILIISISFGGGAALATVVARSAAMFIVISVYYAVLLLMLPLLRRIFSAWACATLWTAPTVLYITISSPVYEQKPSYILTIPQRWLSIFFMILAVGFIGALTWQIVSHIKYRKYLLKHSIEASDAGLLSMWHSESKKHGVKTEIPVLLSDKVNSPVTIGCFDRTMRLILPTSNYSNEELTLIFRHELRHILRADTRTKLFIGFFGAVCWFNPLSWIARRKVADDLELSCDEAVLSDAYDSTRKQYAELLLKNAGCSWGFTTNLSVAASSLRYRLRNIINPAKRLAGGVVVGIAVVGLFMALGTFALADTADSVQALVFDKAPAGIVPSGVSTFRWSQEQFGYNEIHAWESAALTEYLASLTVARIYQVYSEDLMKSGVRRIYADYGEIVDGMPVSLTRLRLCDGLLYANIPYDDYGEIAFIIEDEIDWGYIESLLDFDAPNPNPYPEIPAMMMYFGETMSGDEIDLMHASRTILSVFAGDVEQIVNPHLNDVDVGGVYGFPATEVNLYFTYPPRDGYTVKVETWDRSSSYSLSSSRLENDLLPLAPYSAHYTVSGVFESHWDTTYIMNFSFDVELP